MFLNFYLTHVLKHLLDFYKIWLSFIPSGTIIFYSFYLSMISEYETLYSRTFSKRKNKLPLQVKDIYRYVLFIVWKVLQFELLTCLWKFSEVLCTAQINNSTGMVTYEDTHSSWCPPLSDTSPQQITEQSVSLD
jgi:hypothetical protein